MENNHFLLSFFSRSDCIIINLQFLFLATDANVSIDLNDDSRINASTKKLDANLDFLLYQSGSFY